MMPKNITIFVIHVQRNFTHEKLSNRFFSVPFFSDVSTLCIIKCTNGDYIMSCFYCAECEQTIDSDYHGYNMTDTGRELCDCCLEDEQDLLSEEVKPTQEECNRLFNCHSLLGELI